MVQLYREFLYNKTGRTWDEISSYDFNKNEIDEETIFKFVNRAEERIPSIRNDKDVEQILGKLYLINKNKIKNAGILLFAKNPQAIFIQSKIKIGKFINEADIETQDIVEGNLFKQVLNSIEIITTKYLRRIVKFEKNNIERIDELEYPLEALREAILNAMVHRDYTSSAEIQIRIYKDKLLIMNPGILPTEISIESLKSTHISKPRNPYIAGVFQKAGYIESWGRGTNKILKACIDAGLPEPEFNDEHGIFSVTFYKSMLSEDNLAKMGLNERQIKALAFVKSKGSINNKNYRELNNVAHDTASIELKDMLKKGIFMAIGKGRSFSYQLKIKK